MNCQINDLLDMVRNVSNNENKNVIGAAESILSLCALNLRECHVNIPDEQQNNLRILIDEQSKT